MTVAIWSSPEIFSMVVIGPAPGTTTVSRCCLANVNRAWMAALSQ